jgi:hypothetical protein
VNRKPRIFRLAVTGLVALAMIAAVGFRAGYRPHRAHAQVTQPFGYVPAINTFTPTVISGAAGTVTNPASNFIVQVDGGPIYCSGEQNSISESTLTLQANNTYLLVYNCPLSQVYAKQAVVGPGVSGTAVGIPNSVLFAVPGVEVALNTVVCNATACGNGGNGSLTDARPLASFPAGAVQTGSVLFANLPATFPNGGVLYCSNCLLASSPCTGASTGAMALRVNGAWRCQ